MPKICPRGGTSRFTDTSHTSRRLQAIHSVIYILHFQATFHRGLAQAVRGQRTQQHNPEGGRNFGRELRRGFSFFSFLAFCFCFFHAFPSMTRTFHDGNLASKAARAPTLQSSCRGTCPIFAYTCSSGEIRILVIRSFFSVLGPRRTYFFIAAAEGKTRPCIAVDPWP